MKTPLDAFQRGFALLITCLIDPANSLFDQRSRTWVVSPGSQPVPGIGWAVEVCAPLWLRFGGFVLGSP